MIMLLHTASCMIQYVDAAISTSSDSSDEEEMTDELMKRMLKKHKQMKKIREKTRHQPVRPKRIFYRGTISLACYDQEKNQLEKSAISMKCKLLYPRYRIPDTVLLSSLLIHRLHTSVRLSIFNSYNYINFDF